MSNAAANHVKSIGDDFLEDNVGGNITENVTGKVLELVSSKAKATVTKGIDYTLLITLLVVQYMRCEQADINDLVKASNGGTIQTADLYSCDTLQNEKIMSGGIIAAAVLCLSYGICASAFVWFHAARTGSKVESEPKGIEKIYEWTEKLILVDTILEIPISFFWAPIVTVCLWGFFTLICIGLYFTANNFGAKVDDPSASSTFQMSCFLVIMSLLKLTGEVSQYWVIFKASGETDSAEKMVEFDLKKKAKA